MMEDGHCVRTLHAEANAIIQAARNGVRIEGADIYVTASPCWGCFKMIANAGLRRIVFGEFYRDERIFALRLGARHRALRISAVGRTAQKGKGPTTPAFRHRCSLPGLAGFTARCR